jgi:hypothetical protein
LGQIKPIPHKKFFIKHDKKQNVEIMYCSENTRITISESGGEIEKKFEEKMS